MLGRAGRPLYDKEGEGIVITTGQELGYYLALLNEQAPIESSLLPVIAESLNAEVVSGQVTDIKEAIGWLKRTYLYFRIKRNPKLYGLGLQEPTCKDIMRYLLDIVHTSAIELDKAGLMRYEQATGRFKPTQEGRVASYYYVKPDNIGVYLQGLKPDIGYVDLLRLFCSSAEFKQLLIRDEEKIEIHKLYTQVPIPIKSSIDDPRTKVSILLQCFISKIQLEGYALNCDVQFVAQNAPRIFRALFELALVKRLASADLLLLFCKMVERQQWSVLTPLR